MDAWRNLSPRAKLYLELGGVIALSVILWFTLRSRIALAADWLPNLGTEMFAFVASVFFIDRALEEERAIRRSKILNLARRSLIHKLVPLTSQVVLEERMFTGRDIDPETGLRQLFTEWASAVRLDGFNKREPSSSVRTILNNARDWGEVRDRFFQVLELHALSLLTALDSYVSWIDVNRDLFEYKVSRWETGQQFTEAHWNSGKPHESLAGMTAQAAEGIARVLEILELSGVSSVVGDEAARAVSVAWSPQGMSLWMSERPARELPLE
jgi:hypothetical protein